LSIDVAIGSIGSSVLAVNVLNVKLPLFYWLILPLCVWIIYTSDHLLDAFKIKDKAISGRHKFHFIHRKKIIFALFLAGMLSVFLIERHLEKEMVVLGFCIYFFILVYLLSNHFANKIFKFLPREVIIAAGYIAGTWGIPLLVKSPFVSRYDWLFLLNHFLIILTIPLLYSIFEYTADESSGFISFSTTFGTKVASILVTVLLVISSLVSGISYIILHNSISIILFAMSGMLFLTLFYRKKLMVDEKYRTICDSTNFLPFLLLIK
jgi:4-hydroxybenzoate polyprenyltransferase